MAFPQNGYLGSYTQHDNRYAMHPYNANVAQQGALMYAPHAMDAGQGYWQAPHAPRLTAAAPRAGRLPAMAHEMQAYSLMTGQSPWHQQYAPPPSHYLQHNSQQPRTHQQLEHQLLLQHQMGNGRNAPQPSAHHQHIRQTSSRPQSRGYEEGVWYSSHPQNHGRSHSHRDTWDATLAPEYEVPTQVGQQNARDWRGSASAWSNWQQQAHRNSVPHLAYASQYHQPQHYIGHRASWASSDNSVAPEQWHGRSHTQPQVEQYPLVSDAQASRGSVYPAAPVDFHALGNEHMLAMQHSHQYTSLHEQASRARQHASQFGRRPSPDLWQPRPETRRLDLHQDDAKEGVVKTEPDVAAANAAQGPAPPSPDTLDNSAVSIAAIGAQLIWNACTSLFDPELLADAHDVAVEEGMDEDTDEQSSPTRNSVPSSASTPPASTPDISPWASTVLDKPSDSGANWDAFRSPFGPKPNSDPSKPSRHGRVGSDASFSNDLHRMAVGAERNIPSSHVQNDGARRQGSGADSDLAAAHSSGASTASSSEPGTPVSVEQHPAFNSTPEPHRSFRSNSAMSIDENSPKPLIVSPKGTSKRSDNSTSSRWSNRMRDNVLAVLRLVSPEWKWSNNDHQLVSLIAPSGPTAAMEPGHSRGRDSMAGVVTSYANEPSPAFRRFAHQVLSQTLLSPTAYLLGILNALRVPLMARLDDGSIDPTVIELFAQPTSAAPFKLLTLGLMMSNKHLDDNTFLNKTWNEVTGIPLLELNQMEAWFLKKCNYEITVPDDTWVSFLHKLQSWEEKRSSHGAHRDRDCAKRLLIVLDEAIGHFDVIPGFRLDQTQHAELRGSKSIVPTPASQSDSEADSWGRCYKRPAMADLGVRHPQSQSTPAIGNFSSRDHNKWEAEQDSSSALLRSRSDNAASSSSKTISPVSDAGKGTMSGPLMPSTLLNGSRALLHGSSFAPLATSS